MVNSKKEVFIALVIVVVLLVAGFFIFLKVYQKTPSSPNLKIVGNVIAGNENPVASPSGAKTYTIEITSSGFSPRTLNISKGDSVTWVNKDSKPSWPASAMHPTHTKYAGGDYEEQGSYAGSLACMAEGVPKDGVFDPCNGIAPGKSWSFTFEQIGSWGFHDHINSGRYGKINVQ
ncbi:MAG: hypothetical protein AABX85_01855 [Nanoarchaeota archaeon]